MQAVVSLVGCCVGGNQRGGWRGGLRGSECFQHMLTIVPGGMNKSNLFAVTGKSPSEAPKTPKLEMNES